MWFYNKIYIDVLWRWFEFGNVYIVFIVLYLFSLGCEWMIKYEVMYVDVLVRGINKLNEEIGNEMVGVVYEKVFMNILLRIDIVYEIGILFCDKFIGIREFSVVLFVIYC